MRIWLINHYAVPPQYYPLARPSLFAKNLMKMGHEVVIIAASTVHNSNENLITDNKRTKLLISDGIPYYLIKCPGYQGNGISRIVNIICFAQRLPKMVSALEKPDVIVTTSFDPLSCYAGIKYAKRKNIKAVAEIADLWPETLVAYNGLSPNNILVKWLRYIEKQIYTKADSVVFTADGEYEYIIKQGWHSILPKSKFFFINNGVDLEQFDYNKKHYTIDDADLENEKQFNVVYTGAIRKVNHLSGLLDVAKKVKNPKIKFLVWGDGDELPKLKKRIIEESITNVVFKGRVDKKYIPYITSRATINYAHNSPSPLFVYGISFNKIFDYLAAGRPILCDFYAEYNPVLMGNAGVSVETADPNDIAVQIERFADMQEEELAAFCRNARATAEEYDFKKLTIKLLDAIGIDEEK
jgi:glycosyltransferase involved in cell wall biosynthesis